MLSAMGTWELSAEELQPRLDRIIDILGEDLLSKLFRATPRDRWHIRVGTENGSWHVYYLHTHTDGSIVGAYKVRVISVGETIAESKVQCDCPESQRDRKRLGAWCKHELFTLFLWRPRFAKDARQTLQIVCNSR